MLPLGVYGSARVTPTPAPAGFPPTWAGARLTTPLARAITASKDRGRRDLIPVLAPVLAAAVSGARDSRGPELCLVPVPGSAAAHRRRGSRPLEDLVVAAAELLPGEVSVVRGLELCRRTADQSGLSASARADNLRGAMRVNGLGERARRAQVVLVDDIVTSGATLAEAARALREVGIVPSAAALAATGRRGSTPGSEGRRRPGEAPGVVREGWAH